MHVLHPNLAPTQIDDLGEIGNQIDDLGTPANRCATFLGNAHRWLSVAVGNIQILICLLLRLLQNLDLVL